MKTENTEVKRKFNDVRAALGDCILDSTPYEVIECVRELAEYARKTGFEPKMMNP